MGSTMADPITGPLADMLSSTVDVVSVVHDGHGNEADGITTPLDCHISGKTRLVRNRQGQEVVSNYKLTFFGDNRLTVDDHLYTLPEGYDPRSRRKAIAVKTVTDENPGIHHQSVMLP